MVRDVVNDERSAARARVAELASVQTKGICEPHWNILKQKSKNVFIKAIFGCKAAAIKRIQPTTSPSLTPQTDGKTTATTATIPFGATTVATNAAESASQRLCEQSSITHIHMHVESGRKLPGNGQIFKYSNIRHNYNIQMYICQQIVPS